MTSRSRSWKSATVSAASSSTTSARARGAPRSCQASASDSSVFAARFVTVPRPPRPRASSSSRAPSFSGTREALTASLTSHASAWVSDEADPVSVVHETARSSSSRPTTCRSSGFPLVNSTMRAMTSPVNSGAYERSTPTASDASRSPTATTSNRLERRSSSAPSRRDVTTNFQSRSPELSCAIAVAIRPGYGAPSRSSRSRTGASSGIDLAICTASFRDGPPAEP